MDGKTRYHHSANQSERGNDAQNFELSIAKDTSRRFWQIYVSGDVAKDVSKARKSASPSIGIFLLVSRSIVNDKSANPCLNCWLFSKLYK